jgi:hypothetical protein
MFNLNQNTIRTDLRSKQTEILAYRFQANNPIQNRQQLSAQQQKLIAPSMINIFNRGTI